MAAQKASLRAVRTGEKKPVPKTITEAAEAGDHRELLVAMRSRIARAVQDTECPPRELAALTRRLQDIAKEIDALDIQAKEEARQDGVTPDEEWTAETL